MSPSHPPFRWATVSADGTHWLLRRNCSVSPKQVGWFFAGLCGVSLGVAGFFWWQGATLVLPFTAVELMAVGTAFLVFARHATDRERISLRDGRLVVELETAGGRRRGGTGRWGARRPDQPCGENAPKGLIYVNCSGRTPRFFWHHGQIPPIRARLSGPSNSPAGDPVMPLSCGRRAAWRACPRPKPTVKGPAARGERA